MVWPACVTPFDGSGEVDVLSLAKVLALFRAAGCDGAVLAGTNGEGPSLSAVEKRDLIRRGVEVGEGLPLMLGIATASLHEATWLASQAGKAGAAGVLLMPPGYFRNAPEGGVVDWLTAVIEASTCPVVVYNFPKFSGFVFSGEVLAQLAGHENVWGVKDSSGEAENLAVFRAAVPEGKVLFTGDETLLVRALEAGWTGTISGAANLVSPFLVSVLRDWREGRDAEARERFAMLLPVLEAIRGSSQPASNKAVLARWGVIDRAEPRLPLQGVDGSGLAAAIEAGLGLSARNLGV